MSIQASLSVCHEVVIRISRAIVLGSYCDLSAGLTMSLKSLKELGMDLVIVLAVVLSRAG